ncbi:hypothetical protein [Kutzneria chonburiensis]|uniref:Uncharacterized protein n=1 Tax=Kutzneria chonburiensis TaxID=1483604 RepID=A0ABV6N3P2_9PSEU|nr:hypothetical protein [Kutzneria chonburiensis]
MAELRAVPGLADDLDVTLSRRDRRGDPVGYVRRSTTGALLPYNPRAAHVAETLVNTLSSWAHLVAERRGLDVDADRTAAGMARWLAAHRDDVRQCEDAAAMFDEITYATGIARRCVDAPAERAYAGPCDECGADLYARLESLDVRCVRCATVYNVNDRRKWLLDAAMDMWLTPAQMARALPGLISRPLTTAMIQGYVRRGRVESRVDTDGHRRVSVRAIVELLQIVTPEHHF